MGFNPCGASRKAHRRRGWQPPLDVSDVLKVSRLGVRDGRPSVVSGPIGQFRGFPFDKRSKPVSWFQQHFVPSGKGSNQARFRGGSQRERKAGICQVLRTMDSILRTGIGLRQEHTTMPQRCPRRGRFPLFRRPQPQGCPSGYRHHPMPIQCAPRRRKGCFQIVPRPIGHNTR